MDSGGEMSAGVRASSTTPSVVAMGTAASSEAIVVDMRRVASSALVVERWERSEGRRWQRAGIIYRGGESYWGGGFTRLLVMVGGR